MKYLISKNELLESLFNIGRRQKTRPPPPPLSPPPPPPVVKEIRFLLWQKILSVFFETQLRKLQPLPPSERRGNFLNTKWDVLPTRQERCHHPRDRSSRVTVWFKRIRAVLHLEAFKERWNLIEYCGKHKYKLTLGRKLTNQRFDLKFKTK